MAAAFESLREGIDDLFDDFGRGLRQPFRRSLFAGEPLFRRGLTRATTPAVDVVESEKAYEITAELPGMDEKNIEVKMTDGGLTIKGEKQEEKEEKKKDYYLHERHLARSNAASMCPRALTRTRSKQASRKASLR